MANDDSDVWGWVAAVVVGAIAIAIVIALWRWILGIGIPIGLLAGWYFLFMREDGYFSAKRQTERAQERGEADAGAAIEQGRVGEGLRWYAENDKLNDYDLERLLGAAVPNGMIKDALLSAVRELGSLKASTEKARAVGVSPAIASGIERDADQALAQLWPTATRLAAASSQGVTSEAFQQRAKTEVEKLTRLTDATHQAKDGLAIAMLPGNSGLDTDTLEANLRLMGKLARDLGAS